MAKSIKLGADTYLDASGVVINTNKTLDAFMKSASVTASFLVGDLNANSDISASILGNILFVTGYLQTTVEIATNTFIAEIGAFPKMQVVDSPNGSGGTTGRLILRQNGRIQTEAVFPTGQWFSFSFVVPIA